MSENTMNNLKIGVDVGGTKIEAVLVDAMGTVLGSARIPARHGNDAVIEDIVAVAHQAAGERFDEVRAIGVGTPGTVDSALSAPFRGAQIGRPAPDAARDLLAVLDTLQPADSGGFWAYDGQRLPW